MMTFAERCRVYGVRIAAYEMASRGVALPDALAILKWSRLGRVRRLSANVWVPEEVQR